MINKNQILKAELFGDGMLRVGDRYSKIYLNHIPVMITDKGKILCIPNSEEGFHIGVTAAMGKGKGILGNNLLGMEYWFLKKPCIILNDFQQETLENSLPSMNNIFNNNLKIINVNPIGLPIVYVYPSNKNLDIKPVEQLFPHIKMCLPTSVIIENIEHYYKMGASGKYITGYIDRFLECKTLDDINNTILEILQEAFPDKKSKGFEEMRFKISTIFKNIFDEEISDTVCAPDVYSYLKVKSNKLNNYYNQDGFYQNLTIQCLIALGLIPSIQTSDIKGERWFSAYMSFIVKSIYDDKFKDAYFKDKNLIMYCPEIDKLWGKDSGMDKGALIKEKLCLVGTNGRRAGISLIWDTQIYDAVPEPIRSNTAFLFVLRKGNDEEVREIKKDFNVNKEVQGWILGLRTEPEKGLFECVALTTREHILYNPRDGTISKSSEPQRGRLLTPMSHHKQPGRPIASVIELREGDLWNI